MSKILTLSAVAVLVFAASAPAAEVEYLLASWENTMDHFGTVNFDSVAFNTIEGVTNGSTALELDLLAGWQQGLVTGGQPDWNWPAGFWAMGGATKLRLDVTTSNSLANVAMADGIQLAMYFQGATPSGVSFGGTYSYNLIMSVYQPNTTTETLEWDLTKDLNGNPMALLPAIDPLATGGWFDMRIHTNVTTATNPGLIMIDNLRAVHVVNTGGLGDFNGDKTVNQADYTSWADNFNLTISAARAANSILFPDGTFVPDPAMANPLDTVITQAFYTTWADKFGTTYPASVPEPATMSLLVLGALGLIRRR